MVDKAMALWQYCASGVWNDPRQNWRVRTVKILNLSVSSFFDRDLQVKSMALTYSTVLSIVPALALMIAIGRGFGLQDAVQNELYVLLPSQHQVITTFLGFVDSYLSASNQGLFVGVGIIVLLWTIFSLLSGIEDASNSIWDIRSKRSLFHQFTDYITICLMVPLLLICSSGISIFMSTIVQNVVFLPFLTPMVNFILELAPLVLSWLAFTLSYLLFPNTKVKFRFAAISGAVAAIGFYVLQWLFINGQIYVSKYNAIYGSFAFLPLMLIWLQLSWLILLTGCVLTYSFQNIFTYNFLGDADRISYQSFQRVAILVMAIVTQRFVRREEMLSVNQLAAQYNLPVRILERVVARLRAAKLLNISRTEDNVDAVTPACEVADLTAGDTLTAFNTIGEKSIAPDFEQIFAPLFHLLDQAVTDSIKPFNRLKLVDLPIPLPEQVASLLEASAAATTTPAK